MTSQQVQSLKLGIAPIGERETLIIESGLEWVQQNTTLEFDINKDEDLTALPSYVRLFLIKFFDVQMLGTGISSQSIEGLSVSFDTSNKSALLWQFAEELFPPNILKSCVRFVTAQKRWN